ncbi:hypothetical protein [Rhodococcus marinonascens]|uniref:hypothetical protein n=1 Tax=Rhodococcus marinonascens TaxID=38311 RepID=UPI0009333C07|nr:hypothetical protein [Rhodococcus marinonascens]
MTSPSEAAAARSRRLHTVKNVDRNVKAARARALEHHKRIEELAKPLNAVSEKLAQLDRQAETVGAAGDRRIESLRSGLGKKIDKLKADTAAKIEQTEQDTETKIEALRTAQRGSEEALLIEHAQAVVAFSDGGSPADLATVLGLSQKQAKDLIDSSKADLDAAGLTPSGAADTSPTENVDAPTAPATATPTPPAADPANAADETTPAAVDSAVLASA